MVPTIAGYSCVRASDVRFFPIKTESHHAFNRRTSRQFRYRPIRNSRTCGHLSARHKGGDIIYTSSQLPLVNGALLNPGGDGCVTDEREAVAANAAGIAALNTVAAVRYVIEKLERITQIMKLTVYVSSVEGFTNQYKVANGASEIIGTIFGDAGRYVRNEVGVQFLPLNSRIEVNLIALLTI